MTGARRRSVESFRHRLAESRHAANGDQLPPLTLTDTLRTGLTRRNIEVAELVAAGLTNRQIGQRLYVSERTVEWHVDQILNRLGFATRSQVAAWVGRTQAVPVLPPRPRQVSNLPSAITTFVGRRPDLNALRRLLTANRLVTLVGPGGIGKTRLAVALAEQVAADYPDGVWLCDLAPLEHPEMVGDAVAQALPVTTRSADRAAAVREFLSERRALLVLDNCERVHTATGDLAQTLLTAGPHLRVLATSRTSLSVTGEAVWRVLPLELSDARRLFKQRASVAAPGCNVGDAEAGASVTIICQRLDNLPLALELAAPTLRRLSLDELSAAVLDGQWQHQASGRHGNLDSVVDWSYQLLTAEEQALFLRLSVFAGWFEAEDAAGLTPSGVPVRTVLGQLLEKSMLMAEQPARATVRYRLLQVMKPFARDRLAACGATEGARLAHAERMISLAEGLDANDDARNRGTGYKLAAMVDDLRAALETLRERRPADAARLAVALEPFWLDTGRLEEGARRTSDALSVNPVPSLERCQLLYTHAHLLYRQGRREEGAAAFQEGQQLLELPECARVHGDLLLTTAMIQTLRSDIAAAEVSQRKAIDAFARSGLELKASRALNHLALTLLFQQRPREAEQLARRSVAIRRHHGIRLQVSLDTLAQAQAILGNLDEARTSFLEAMELALSEQDMLTAQSGLFGLSLVIGSLGDHETALRLYFCADHLLPEMTGRYDDPLAPHVREIIQRSEAEVASDDLARLRIDGESLGALAALHLARAQS